MTHPTPDRRSRRRRWLVEALEHRLQPSAGLADFPAGIVPPAAVAGPLPLSVVDVPLFPGPAIASSTISVPFVPPTGSPIVVGGQYATTFDVPAAGELGGTLVAAPSPPAKALVAVNLAPVATDDSYTTAVNLLVLSTPLTVSGAGVLGNDADPEGAALTAELVTGPARGLLVFRPDGSFTYTAVLNFSGTDSFTYRVTDGTTWSPAATVFINVSSANRPPVARADGYSTTEDAPLTVAPAGVLGNDADPDGDTLAAVADSLPANGTLRFDTNGGFCYTPAPGWSGTDSFTYHATDGSRASTPVTVTITVTPVNDPPVAVDDAFVTAVNTPLTVAAGGVLGNDGDPDGDALGAVLVAGPANGTLTLNADGSFTYTPDAGYVGLDSFDYQAADAGGGTDTARVTILVRRANRAPTGTADAVATVAGTPVVLTAAAALANDTDPDGDPMTAVLVNGAVNGTVTTAADGSFVYTPDVGFSGTDTFTYRVTDGALASGLVQVTVTVASPLATVPPPPAPVPEPTGTPTPPEPTAPTSTPTPTGSTPPTAPAPPNLPAGPTTPTVPAVSIAPSASGSYDGFGPIGGGPAGTISPVPAVSSGGANPSPRTDTPTATDAGRVYSSGDAPAAAGPVPPEVAPQPASPPLQPTAAPPPEAPPPPVVVLPPEPPAALPPNALAVPPPPTNAVLPDTLLAPLDRIRDELRAEAAERATTDTVVVAGGVAVAGTVLLNTRAVYWFLSALLARPAVWRRFDPLDVVYAWERENARRGTGPDDSLQSMVG